MMARLPTVNYTRSLGRYAREHAIKGRDLDAFVAQHGGPVGLPSDEQIAFLTEAAELPYYLVLHHLRGLTVCRPSPFIREQPRVMAHISHAEIMQRRRRTPYSQEIAALMDQVPAFYMDGAYVEGTDPQGRRVLITPTTGRGKHHGTRYLTVLLRRREEGNLLGTGSRRVRINLKTEGIKPL